MTTSRILASYQNPKKTRDFAEFREFAMDRFYRNLKLREVSVRVGIEPTGYARWFGRLLGELVLRLSARGEAQKDFSFGTCKLLLFS